MYKDALNAIHLKVRQPPVMLSSHLEKPNQCALAKIHYSESIVEFFHMDNHLGPFHSVENVRSSHNPGDAVTAGLSIQKQ